MSIAYGGIIVFLFRGVNLVVALGIVLFCTNQMGASNYGAFVLGLTIVGFVNAATGGLTAATAYQVSNQRQPPPVALLNGGSSVYRWAPSPSARASSQARYLLETLAGNRWRLAPPAPR
ncbi:MAG: hypothetical protein M5U18_19135 [Dehalococcoidia bacterium]|nr:hypothetical protein [Dehalococcoidia bacterium]